MLCALQRYWRTSLALLLAMVHCKCISCIVHACSLALFIPTLPQMPPRLRQHVMPLCHNHTQCSCGLRCCCHAAACTRWHLRSHTFCRCHQYSWSSAAAAAPQTMPAPWSAGCGLASPSLCLHGGSSLHLQHSGTEVPELTAPFIH